MRLEWKNKVLQLVILLGLTTTLFSFTSNPPVPLYVSPLAAFSEEWNDSKYAICNTAANVDYLNEEEKSLIHILNLARTNPALFANTVITKYVNTTDKKYLLKNKYLISLFATMKNLKATGILEPDKKCFTSASCHAETSGLSGYVGHDRANNKCEKNSYYFGECCDYGHDKALDILMALLIDENVSSLGHRKICLDPSYKTIGVSIQPHKIYRHNAVLDFAY
ncbi:MAG: hypothetical protein ABIW38_10290 [Ferruginibacter sp.]